MSKQTVELQPQARIQFLNLLPQSAGSIEESIQIKRLRDKLGLTEEEQEKVNFNPQTGSFDPNKLSVLDGTEIVLGEQTRKVLAGAIVQREDQGNVPTNDTFVELAVELKDEIDEIKDSLDE